MSDIRANTISDASGNGPINLHKQSAAKAGVNVSSASDITTSFNVSSVTNTGTGLRLVSYANSFTNADCIVSAACSSPSARFLVVDSGNTVSSTPIRTVSDTGSAVSCRFSLSSDGDLA